MYCINTVSKNPWNYEQTEKAHFGEEKNDCTLFSIAKKKIRIHLLLKLFLWFMIFFLKQTKCTYKIHTKYS